MAPRLEQLTTTDKARCTTQLPEYATEEQAMTDILSAYQQAILRDDTLTEAEIEKAVRGLTPGAPLIRAAILARQVLFVAQREARDMGEDFEPTMLTLLAETVIAETDRMFEPATEGTAP
jgi:hypothetical protein